MLNGKNNIVNGDIDKLFGMTNSSTDTSNVSQLLTNYIGQGWHLCKIPAGQKGPRSPGWQKKENAITTADQVQQQLTDCNVGLLHEHSRTCAIDIDDYQKSVEFLEQYDIDLMQLLSADDAVQISSGKPNRAKLLYKLPEGVEPLPRKTMGGDNNQALELRCKGVQDVLPPSIHPETKKPYTWAGAGDFRKLPELPTQLLKLWRSRVGQSKQQSTPHHAVTNLDTDEIVIALKAADRYIKNAGNGKHLIRCPRESEHSMNGGQGETAYFMPHTNGHEYPAVHCFHTHKITIKELRVSLGLDTADNEGNTLLKTKVFSLNDLINDAVFLAHTDRVTLLSNPRLDCSFESFKRLTAASKISIETDSGDKKKKAADIWIDSPKRKTAFGLTFAPGEDQICNDPSGDICVNKWRPVQHNVPDNWKHRIKPFIEHLQYLIPDKYLYEQVLMWLAHMIQKPGDMPPWHVLMYTDLAQGIGRNWLAACIGQVLNPYAALHIDISALAGTKDGAGFNGVLSCKLFACVDELHASAFATGGRRMMETLKSTVMADKREINPKYGRQIIEFNRIRSMILSNYMDTMPLPRDDRRWTVVQNPSTPRTESKYIALYRLLRDKKFIAAVYQYLKALDISKLKFGPAPMSDAKQSLIEATEPDFVTTIRETIEQSGVELIVTSNLKLQTGITDNWKIREGLKAAGAIKRSGQIRINKKPEYVWIIKNHAHWLNASNSEIRLKLDSTVVHVY